MKVRASVKRLCESCKIVRRKNVVRVICKNPVTNRAGLSLRDSNWQSQIQIPQHHAQTVGRNSWRQAHRASLPISTDWPDNTKRILEVANVDPNVRAKDCRLSS